MTKVFIDGSEGTTGLRIYERFEKRDDIEIIKIDPELRKDPAERARLINSSDITFLCLPDAASKESVSLVSNPDVRIIDASTAHRTEEGWAYGYPEQEAQRIAVQTIAAFLETHPDMTVTLVIYDGTPDRRRSWYPEISELLDRSGKNGPGQSGSAFFGAQKAAKPRRRLFRNMNFAGAVRKETADTAAEIAADAEYCMAEPMPAAVPASLKEELLHADESFTQMLLRLIDAHGMTDAECYKKANIDRKLFSKIRSDIHYRTKKATAIAFAVALELSAEETEDLLRRAGYAFSPSTPFDIIVLYFIKTGNYNVFEINEALFAYDQVLIGA